MNASLVEARCNFSRPNQQICRAPAQRAFGESQVTPKRAMKSVGSDKLELNMSEFKDKVVEAAEHAAHAISETASKIAHAATEAMHKSEHAVARGTDKAAATTAETANKVQDSAVNAQAAVTAKAKRAARAAGDTLKDVGEKVKTAADGL